MGIQNANFGTASVATAMLLADREQRLMSSAVSSAASLRLSDRDRLAAFAVLTGISLMSAVTFAAGLSAVSAGAPQAWSHGLIVLSIGQIVIVGGAGLKLYGMIGNYKRAQTRSIALGIAERRSKPAVASPGLAASNDVEHDLPKGRLGNREYLEFPDGSIEIDTLLGRRRFISLDAAREFVGA